MGSRTNVCRSSSGALQKFLQLKGPWPYRANPPCLCRPTESKWFGLTRLRAQPSQDLNICEQTSVSASTTQSHLWHVTPLYIHMEVRLLEEAHSDFFLPGQAPAKNSFFYTGPGKVVLPGLVCVYDLYPFTPTTAASGHGGPHSTSESSVAQSQVNPLPRHFSV